MIDDAVVITVMPSQNKIISLSSNENLVLVVTFFLNARINVIGNGHGVRRSLRLSLRKCRGACSRSRLPIGANEGFAWLRTAGFKGGKLCQR